LPSHLSLPPQCAAMRPNHFSEQTRRAAKQTHC
jgi:hypothetical protein